MIQAICDILQHMKTKRTKSILVAISSSNAASRQKLRGIYRYALRKDDWDITLVRSPADLTPQLLEECANGDIDGFILSSDECSTEIGRVVPADKPIIAIEIWKKIPAKRSRRNTLVLKTDNAAIGDMAAAHFRSLGRFSSFAYIPDEKGRDWSKLRGDAFMDALASSGHHAETYDATQETIPEFLSRQELPVAVFAAWDFLAAKVIKECHRIDLNIPSQVSVLGVDDDDLICESVKPPLSTILVDRIKQGFMAAKALDAMMKFPKSTHAQDYIALPVKVVQRESTAYLSTGAAIIERARKFIEDHATEDIDVNDVARAICISRRLLDLRFQESRMGSVAAMIRTKRLSKVKSLLKQTTLSDSRIAMRCGFKSVGTLRNLFRNTFGMSMRTYRTQH